jgi:hypothetical protein
LGKQVQARHMSDRCIAADGVAPELGCRQPAGWGRLGGGAGRGGGGEYAPHPSTPAHPAFSNEAFTTKLGRELRISSNDYYSITTALLHHGNRVTTALLRHYFSITPELLQITTALLPLYNSITTDYCIITAPLQQHYYRLPRHYCTITTTLLHITTALLHHNF